MKFLKQAISRFVDGTGLGDAFEQPLFTAAVLVIILIISLAATKFFRAWP